MKFAKFLKHIFLQNNSSGYFSNQKYTYYSCDLLHIRIGNLDWNDSHEKETKHIHASHVNSLNIRIGNIDWCKCRHCNNKAREIYCLCCREVDAMHIALLLL